MPLRDTEGKLRSTEAFCDIARYLTSNPPVPVESGQNPDKELNKRRLSRNIVAHMLYAIIFENSIKMLWETEHNRECAYTHNIRAIFNELGDEARKSVEDMCQNQTNASELLRQQEIIKNSNLPTSLNWPHWNSFTIQPANNEKLQI